MTGSTSGQSQQQTSWAGKLDTQLDTHSHWNDYSQPDQSAASQQPFASTSQLSGGAEPNFLQDPSALAGWSIDYSTQQFNQSAQQPSQPIGLVPSPTAYRFDSAVFDWGEAQQRGGNSGTVQMDSFESYGTPSYYGSYGSDFSQGGGGGGSLLYSEPASFAQMNQPSSFAAGPSGDLKFVWDRQATLQAGKLSMDNVGNSTGNLAGLQSYREPDGYDNASQDGRSASPAPSAWASDLGVEHDMEGTVDDTTATAAAFSQLMGASRNNSPAKSPPAPTDQFATRTNPTWPAVSSPALSPPVLNVPSVTRASPALPQLTIPSGLEAPSLNLIQPTPMSAAPRPGKGKGTLELERVLNMFTTKVSASSLFTSTFLRLRRSGPSSLGCDGGQDDGGPLSLPDRALAVPVPSHGPRRR